LPSGCPKMHKKIISSQVLKVSQMINFSRHSKKYINLNVCPVMQAGKEVWQCNKYVKKEGVACRTKITSIL